MAAFFLAAIVPLAYLFVTGLAPLRNGAHMGLVAMTRRKGFNMELLVPIIACLLFVPPVAIAVCVMVRIVRDAPREERAFYAAQTARKGN